jgi:hypothetical protein
MGTSGSYSGGGGKAGRDLREDVENWLDGLPPTPPPKERPEDQDPHRIPPHVAPNAVGLFRPRGRPGGGGGGGGGSTGAGGGSRAGGGRRGGGAQRSAARSARTAGRAAAAADAYGTGNAHALSELGHDYDELRRLNDPLELTRRIVDAACGPRSESTIDHEEQRWVAAEIAEWVLAQHEAGELPQPEDVARKTIASIIAEAIESETGELIRQGERPAWATELAENELREAAEVLATKAELSVGGVTEAEFSKAIEDGIETLRGILGGQS